MIFIDFQIVLFCGFLVEGSCSLLRLRAASPDAFVAFPWCVERVAREQLQARISYILYIGYDRLHVRQNEVQNAI